MTVRIRNRFRNRRYVLCDRLACFLPFGVVYRRFIPRNFPRSSSLYGATLDDNVGCSRASVDAQKLIGCLNRELDTIAEDSGSHIQFILRPVILARRLQRMAAVQDHNEHEVCQRVCSDDWQKLMRQLKQTP